MSRHTNSKGSIWKEIKRPSFHFLSFLGGVAFLATLAACGGGSGGGGGGSSPTASSVTGIYTGGTTLTYFHIPGIVDSAYASSYSPSKFTLTLNSSGQFSIADDQGNVGGGNYTISGSTVVISSGTLLLNAGSCTQSSTSSSCSYTIKSGTGGLTVGSGNISGTLDFYSGSTLAFNTTLGLSVNSFASVSLSAIEGQTFTDTFGSSSSPNPVGSQPLNCLAANALAGTTGVTVNGSTVYIPCISWNTYPDGNMSSAAPCSVLTTCFIPNSTAAFKMVFCPSLGQTCYPTGTPPSIIPSYNYPSLSVPSGALAFYVEATSCPSRSCTGGGADVGGYIVPTSGTGGGMVGQFVAESIYCGSTTTYTGTASVVVSTTGSTTGSYFLGAGLPNPSTYTCSGTTYYNYPISFSMFTTTQY